MTTALEVVKDIPLTIGGRVFHSRLLVGTGKYRSHDEMMRALAASGAEVVTVAVRRVDLDRSKDESILHHLDPKRWFLLANTAGCYTAEDAVRYARLAREAGFNDFVKLEVIGDQETLLPDVAGTLEATRVLVKDGFKVLAYPNEDLITALRLEDAGAAAVMPLASPIGSGLGLLNPFHVRTIKRRLGVPVIVDAGVGTASDACITMEQGVDGILMNTALAAARDPVAMAHAMRLAVEAGRAAVASLIQHPFDGRRGHRHLALGHAARQERGAPGFDRETHGVRHGDRVAGCGEGRIHENAVHALLHGDAGVGRGADTRIHDHRHAQPPLDSADMERVEQAQARPGGRGARARRRRRGAGSSFRRARDSCRFPGGGACGPRPRRWSGECPSRLPGRSSSDHPPPTKCTSSTASPGATRTSPSAGRRTMRRLCSTTPPRRARSHTPRRSRSRAPPGRVRRPPLTTIPILLTLPP